MSEPRLSSTELSNLLRSNKIDEFKNIVSNYFAQTSSDHANALKLSKVIAHFAYDENSSRENLVEIVECFNTSVDTVIQKMPSSQLSDDFLKELYVSSFHVMNRLIKLRHVQAVNSFWPEFFKVSNKMKDLKHIYSRASNLYADLWNFALDKEPSSVTERICRLDIARGALEFLLIIKKTEKFSATKFFEKVSWLSKNSVKKDNRKVVVEKVSSLIVELSVKLSENSRQEDFALLVFEIVFNYAPESLEESLHRVKKLLDPGGGKVLVAMELLTKIHRGMELSSLRWSGGRLSDRASAVLLPICRKVLCAVPRVRWTTAPDSLLDLSEAVLALLQEVRPSTAVLDILERLGTLHLHLCKHSTEVADQERTVRVTMNIFRAHLKALQAENTLQESRWSVLSFNCYNTAANYYNKKMYEASEEFFSVAVLAGQQLVRADPSQAGTQRTRLKLQSDVKYRLKQYEAALRCVAEACVLTVSTETDSKAVRRILSELGGFWLSYKVSWLQAGGETVHQTNVLNVLGQHGGHEDWVRLAVARTEVTWYRRHHQTGVDLTQSWVNIMAALLKVSTERTDKALVLLEQTWVNWLGDNTEDLELGARCAEKAVSLLTGHQLESLAWYWRFQCEHRLLSIKVTGQLEKQEISNKKEELVRKEMPGLGEEVKESEPTPAFPELELSVQLRLVRMLETAVNIWRREEFAPSDWFSAKTLCQFQLSTAFHLQLLGHSRLALSVFRLVLQTGREHGALEEESLLAFSELADAGEEVDLVQCLEVGEALSQRKGGGVSDLSHLSGLVLTSDLVRRDKIDAAEELLHRVLDHEQLKTNKMFPVLIRCKASLRLSQLKLRVSSRGCEAPLGWAGPLEIANRCWQFAHLCRVWWDEDIRVPAKHDPSLLWLGPCLADLHLRSLHNLSAMFRLCSVPRELKCYLTTGLKFAQQRCLPLRVSELLVELAQHNLLCEHDAGAQVHLAGTEFILSSLLEDKRPAKVKTGDNSRVLRLPGQDDLSMSPKLIRHNNNPPQYLHHAPHCPCELCHLPTLHFTILGLLFSQAWSLVLQEDVEAALGLYSTARQVSRLARLKCRPGPERERLEQLELRQLAQQGECLAWHRLWQEYDQLAADVSELLASSSYWMKSQPSLYVRCLEQSHSVTMLREKLALQEMVRETDLADQLSSLSCSQDPSATQATPIVARKSESRVAAPKKLQGPSLGIGDPETLAIKLEEALSLVINEETSPAPPPPALEDTRKVPRKPRFEEEPLSENKDVPVIVVDTPRKFFKSRGSSVTLSVKTSEVSTVFDDFKTPVRSLKSYSNFELSIDKNPKTPKTKKKLSEDSKRTPAPSSIRRPGRGRGRKVTMYDSEEEVFATPATSRKQSDRRDSEAEEFATPAPASIRKPGGRGRSVKKSNREVTEQPEEKLPTPVSASVSRSTSSVKSSSLSRMDELSVSEKVKTPTSKNNPGKTTLATRSSTRLRRI